MKTKLSMIVLASMISAPSFAADIERNGFASIVAGQTTSSDQEFDGYTNDLTFDNGSIIGLQATSDLGNGLGMTAQIIAKGEDGWDPEFAWAYLSYDFTDDTRVLVGRQRAPFYMYSDYIDVSYAYPWITPPSGVYSLPFDAINGVSIIHSMQIGQFDTTTHVSYGQNSEPTEVLGELVDVDVESVVIGSFTANRDWLTLRAAYAVANVSFYGDEGSSIDQIADLAAIWEGLGYSNIANGLVSNSDQGSFLQVGFQIDHNDWLFVGEYTEVDLSDSVIGKDDSFYVMAGKRFDNIMLHVTYGQDNSAGKLLTSGITEPAFVDLVAATDAAMNSQNEDSNFATVGARWDFHEAAALKFEYTKHSDDLNGLNDADVVRMAFVTVF
ncbi:porin family protein [Thalassotalea eurytherma]|uniref:Porin n=1 Tax=Thalassotalea eurytherma TaxID=1144278 RepID=A0ABQ6H4V5_9GAMM|nr:hypothetical protein [Thalassotalea eurytherma]GLX83188.1 hypothetical protein theurythT_26400 [Thalassotalea eurytherma]